MQEHPPVPATPDARSPREAPHPLDDPRAMQILSTEHWSLLATRSLSWNESFSRAGLFLSVVSATAVALALVGQASAFGQQFVAFALVMLPVALFVGLATFTRLDEVNAEDAVWVAGMNRIRHAYMEIGPGLRPYFITGTTDDAAGLEQTFGVHRPGTAAAHWLVTMPGMVAVIDGVLGGLIAGLGVNALSRMDMEPSILVGAVVGIVIPIVLAVRSRSSVRWLLGVYRPSFPSGAHAEVRGLGESGSAARPEDDLGQPHP
jgi:hypothetical protein